MIRKILGFAVGMALFNCNAATVVDYDFSLLPTGTAIGSAVNGVTFSLLGGPAPAGLPTTNGAGLTNSAFSGFYPTANILNATFSGVANGISFDFDPYNYFPGGSTGDSYYEAFDIHGTLLETGRLGAVTGGAIGSFSIAAADVGTLQFNNGSTGLESYTMALLSLRATVDPLAAVSPVPEPESYAMLLAGMGLVGALARRGRARRGQADRPSGAAH